MRRLAQQALVMIMAFSLAAPASVAASPKPQKNTEDKTLPGVKPGSIDDVNAIGNRNVGGGLNLYSLEKEIALGKQAAQEVERSSKMINDPVVTEYVNRVGQNLVRNSDAKVPFTIKVIDSDEINAFALPGGFFYVNSGLILHADEEAELADFWETFFQEQADVRVVLPGHSGDV